MFIAKPNLTNFLHAETFETIAEATKYLNDRMKVEPKVNEFGEPVEPVMIYPKMKWEDWALLGKIMTVEETGEYTYIDVGV